MQTHFTPATVQNLNQRGDTPDFQNPSADNSQLREKFQDFVAGTFYKQMLKALRSTQGKPAYLHGGQAEEIFQNQMDEYVAEDLAAHHGSSISDPFFSNFADNFEKRTAEAPSS